MNMSCWLWTMLTLEHGPGKHTGIAYKECNWRYLATCLVIVLIVGTDLNKSNWIKFVLLNTSMWDTNIIGNINQYDTIHHEE